jgi:GMP reductase
MAFDFEHVNLIPKKCIVSSRSECEPSAMLGPYKFALPIVPANMECVIDTRIAKKLASHGYFYIYHRFGNDTLEFAQTMKAEGLPISISVGVGESAKKVLLSLADHRIQPDYVTIDIAHGHADATNDLLDWIRDRFITKPYIIAGNVSTPEAVIELAAHGANAIKVGIGPGSACTTYNATGFGSRGIQASVVAECAVAAKKAGVHIIADGGIKDPGDIAKAIALGADFVMVGGMFSGLIDSPGAIVTDAEGRRYKEFWGSASAHQSGKTRRIEGTKKLMLLKDRHYLEEMAFLKECLQSAISYAGGKDLSALRDVNYVVKK